MVQPPSRVGSRAASPAGGKPGAKHKASPKANAAGGENPSYCFKFAKPDVCQDTSCAFMHLDEAMIEEFKRAGKVLKDMPLLSRDLDVSGRRTMLTETSLLHVPLPWAFLRVP